jgi:hypothetical protein
MMRVLYGEHDWMNEASASQNASSSSITNGSVEIVANAGHHNTTTHEVVRIPTTTTTFTTLMP